MRSTRSNSQNKVKAKNNDNSQNKVKLHAKGWFFTFAQCSLSKEDVLKGLEKHGAVKEYVVCHEKHQDGGDHLHAFIRYDREIQWYAKTQPRKWDIEEYHPHVETARSWRAVEEYCKKDGDYITNVDLDAAKHKKAARNKELLEKDPKQLVMDGTIGLCALPQLLKAKRAFKMLEKPGKIIERKCFWIWGKPRIGKSYLVRSAFDDIYEKSQNKWWDGYEQEDVVLIDDMDTNAKCLSHYIKIWADNYRFNGEVKGDTIQPTYTKLIVTSNYLPEEIFTDDYELLEAVRGRFTIINMVDREEQDKIINLIK